MLQNNSRPIIQLFLRAGKKNGKPALQVTKWITDPEAIKEVIHCANKDIEIDAVISIRNKMQLYSMMAKHKIIKYNLDKKEYEWVI